MKKYFKRHSRYTCEVWIQYASYLILISVFMYVLGKQFIPKDLPVLTVLIYQGPCLPYPINPVRPSVHKEPRSYTI